MPLPVGGIQIPSNASFLVRTKTTTPNGISIELAVCLQYGYTLVTNGWTDGRTDRQYDDGTRPVRIGRLRRGFKTT